MSKTTLRTYNREIETLIEQNQFEQAIAHARHILQFFPKHVHTYRLLGKAYLESQRFGDAADVFQRVLSAIPDDFVSHVGMSIIREDEGNLDEAIWHMERAFEIQPANSAIQGELRRLYGRRDGMEPPKVRLTRGALARMYLKGELYQQAIAELRAALAEDPQRPDLMALLAQAYFQTGQRVEAADSCSVLLKKTPYCLEANRILADILANTERSAEAQVYRQRAQTLDPYAAHTSPAAPTPERVPDTAVSLEKLVWTPGQPITGPQGQPEWAASLGVDIGAAAPQKETLPDWLSDQPEKPPALVPEPSETAAVPPFEPPAPSEEVPAAPPAEGEIPDWMQAAGWKPSVGAGEETAAPEMELPESPALPSEEIAPAEMPDWLQAIAPGEPPPPEQVPPETGEVELPAESPLSDSDALSWLQETPPGPTDSVVTWLEEEQPSLPESPAPAVEMGESLEIPDWLKGLEQPAPAQPVEPEPEVEPVLFETGVEEAEIEPVPDETAGLPDWLAGGALAAGVAGEAAAEELPNWLKDIGEPAEAEAKPADEIPDWLREGGSLELQPEESLEAERPEISAAPPEEQPSAQAEDEAFAWLESLAAKQGAQEALILKPEERRETPPDWVLEAASREPVEPTPPQETGAPEWPPVESPVQALAEEEIEAVPTEELPEWLRGQESPPPVEPEEAVQKYEGLAEELEAPSEAATAEGIPEWLHGLEGAPPAEPEEALQKYEGLAEELEAPSEAAPAEEIPEWLRGLEGAPPVEPEEAVQKYEGLTEELEAPVEAAPAGEIPEWLRGLEGAPPAEPIEAALLFEELAEEPEAPGIAAPDVGAWQIEEQEQPPVEAEAEPADLPDWLRGIGPESSAEAFVQPEESLVAGPSQVQEEAIESAELPSWLAGLEPPGDVEPELGMLFSPQVLATGPLEPASAEEPPTLEGEPAAISDTQPTRLRPSEAAAPLPVEAEIPSVEIPGEGIPEWLRGLGEEQPVVEPMMETPSEEPMPALTEEAAFEVPEVTEQTPFEEPLPALAEEAAFEAPEVMEQAPAEIPVEAPSETDLEAAGKAGISGVSLDDEAAFAWLEGLAARQGAEEALLLKPEERSETPPEWVQKASEEAELAAIPAEEVEAPAIEEISPEIMPTVGEGVPEIEAEQLEPPASMEAEGPIEPLTLEEVGIEVQLEPLTPVEAEAEAQFEPITPAEVEAEAQEARPELPSWLTGVEQAGAIEEELAWTPPVEAPPEAVIEPVEAPPMVEPFRPEETFPPRLDLNDAGLAELERLSGVGFTRAQSIITYRQAFGPFASVDELTSVAGFDEALVESLRDKVGVGAVQPVEPVAETVDIYQVTLIQARNALIQGQSAQALAHYTSLIKAQQALLDVIQDLNEALYRFPVDVSFWEALGDAHVRVGHLQDALDAYTKAEELIR